MKDDLKQVCDSLCISADEVLEVQANIPDEDGLMRAAAFFKVFGDPNRMKILFALKAHTLCVFDLSCLTGMSPSAVSHQLKTLRQAGLVKYRKEGKTVFYSLKDEHVFSILSVGMEHIRESDLN